MRLRLRLYDGLRRPGVCFGLRARFGSGFCSGFALDGGDSSVVELGVGAAGGVLGQGRRLVSKLWKSGREVSRSGNEGRNAHSQIED